MSESQSITAEHHTPGKYKVELVIAWVIVGIPLSYGIFNALKAAVQLFTG